MKLIKDISIERKVLPREKLTDKKSERKVLENQVVSYLNHHGKLRANTIDEIKKISENLNKVIEEFDGRKN